MSMVAATHQITGMSVDPGPAIYDAQYVYSETISYYSNQPNCIDNAVGKPCIGWYNDIAPAGPYPTANLPDQTSTGLTKAQALSYWQDCMNVVRQTNSISPDEIIGVEEYDSDPFEMKYRIVVRYKDDLVFGGATSLYSNIDDALNDPINNSGTNLIYAFAGYLEFVEGEYQGEPYTPPLIQPYGILINTSALLQNGTVCRFTTLQGGIIINEE